MPTFFTAPVETIDQGLYKNGVGDGRGYVTDGTYIGRDDVAIAMPDQSKASIGPQEAYTKTLRQRFLRQRQQMHLEPGTASIHALDEKHPNTFDGTNKACAEWQKLLRTTVPLPAQIRTIAMDAVSSLLKLIQRFYLIRGKEIANSTSVWIWSLLARLDDVGTMNNDEVFAVREFGKRAILVQLSFYDPAAAEQLEDMGADDEAYPNESLTASSIETKPEVEFVECNAEDAAGRENTLITLDMIVAIVGEVFGQRDLLEFRREWTTN